MIAAYESKVKHAQCYDVALIDDSIVLARLFLHLLFSTHLKAEIALFFQQRLSSLLVQIPASISIATEQLAMASTGMESIENKSLSVQYTQTRPAGRIGRQKSACCGVPHLPNQKCSRRVCSYAYCKMFVCSLVYFYINKPIINFRVNDISHKNFVTFWTEIRKPNPHIISPIHPPLSKLLILLLELKIKVTRCSY